MILIMAGLPLSESASPLTYFHFNLACRVKTFNKDYRAYDKKKQKTVASTSEYYSYSFIQNRRDFIKKRHKRHCNKE